MKKLQNIFALGCLLLSATGVVAQTNVTTTAGATNTVPVFTGTSALGNSPISISGSNVGIGTAGPVYSLDLIGQMKTRLSAGDGTGILAGYSSSNQPWLQFGASDTSARFKLQMNGVNSSTERLSFYAGPLNSVATNETFVIAGNGNVGLGTTSPQTILQVGSLGANTNKLSIPGALNFENIFLGHNNDNGGDALEFVNHGDINGSYGVKFLADTNTGGINGLQLQVAPYATSYSSLSYATALTILAANGAVGIGTTAPSEKLELNGNLKLTAGTGGHITFSDATQQSTAWTGVLSGGDYAESVNVSGARNEYEPGDVLVIDPAAEGNFLKSSTPYSTTVTGIYSTKPGVVGRRQHTAQEHMEEEVPMAMTGIVPTKVSAENGPIKPGDLLVTSSKSGYAMKGTDRNQMLGAVIGKAIGHLDAGVGVIEAVVTLQ